jgi:hypothetical protein
MSILSDSRATGGKVWDPHTENEEPIVTPQQPPKKITVEHIMISGSIIFIIISFYFLLGMMSQSFHQDFKEESKGNVLTYTIPDASRLPGWFDSSLNATKLETTWVRDKTSENSIELINLNETSSSNESLPEKDLDAWYDGKDSYYQVEKRVEGQKVTLTLTKIKNLTALNKAMTS